MKLGMLSVARKELLEAVEYYNGERPGLGFEFAAEFKNTVLRIVEYPDAWQKMSSRSRRCPMNRFPYAVLYHFNAGHILIVAVMHMKRNPESWEKRV